MKHRGFHIPKGHWPKGRRRNSQDERALTDTIRMVKRRLRRVERGVVSRKVLARLCGVNDRTVRRWLAGDDYPPPRLVAKLRQWAERVQ